MKLNLPTWANVVIFFTVFGLFWASLPLGWCDGLLKSFSPAVFVIGFLDGMLGAAFAYDVMFGKKTIAATKDAQKYTNITQANASSYKQRSWGYWIWLACGGVLNIVFIILRIGDL